MVPYFVLLLFWLLRCLPCTKPPHIVMIIADDLGFNDVSFHGSSQIPTPNIDFLAKNGIILNNYYVLPNCSPTRSAIMTGRYPIYTGMQSGTIYAANAWGLGLNEKLLPQYLKSLGYKNHAIGKWHLGFFAPEYTPTRRGFDTFYGFYGGQADYWDHSLASNNYWGLDLHNDTVQSSEPVWTQWGNYSSKMYSMEAVDRIENHDISSPLFLYLAYQAVHSANRVEDPLQAPQFWIDKFKHIRHKGRRKYAAMVAYMDYGIGMVYDALKRRGMLDNSIIIFTTDNGGPANGLNRNWATNYPLRGAKTTVYEGGVRAAGCIYSKLLNQPRKVSLDMMHATDWLPTLVSLAGGNISESLNLDGMNLWDTFQLGKPSPRKEILLNIDPHVYNNAALRMGDWKLVNQSRFYDGWYPPPTAKKIPRENGSDKDFVEYTPYRKNDAEIACGRRPSAPVPCGGKQYMTCLFNIKEDPCEYYDLSKRYPVIYKIMLKLLRGYVKKMAKSRRTTFRDPMANPKRHKGVWVPWKNIVKRGCSVI